jgi:hypothetical protein
MASGSKPWKPVARPITSSPSTRIVVLGQSGDESPTTSTRKSSVRAVIRRAYEGHGPHLIHIPSRNGGHERETAPPTKGPGDRARELTLYEGPCRCPQIPQKSRNPGVILGRSAKS